jgi:hypothetical protein
MSEPRRTVRLRGDGDGTFERSPGADRDGHAPTESPHDLDRVAVGVLDRRIAVRDRDAAHVQLARLQGEPQRQQIVDSRIGVDYER